MCVCVCVRACVRAFMCVCEFVFGFACVRTITHLLFDDYSRFDWRSHMYAV